MKIKYKNYLNWPDFPNNLAAAAYFKYKAWRIYDSAEYTIKNKKQANRLIQTVMEEMHVSRKNVKLIKFDYVFGKEVKFK